MSNKNIEEMALFRYGLIAPIVAGINDKKSMSEYFRAVSAKEHTLPDGRTARFCASTLFSWYYKYDKGGINALYSRTRDDFGQSRKLSEKAIETIISLRDAYPHITGTAIHKKLIEEGIIAPDEVSLSTIQRYIGRHVSKEAYTPQDKEVKSFEFEHANDCWQADTSHGPKISIDGCVVETCLIAIIDDASRMVVHAEFYLNDNAINMQDAFKKAIAKHGKPARLFVDNGPPYRNLQLEMICASLGIVLIHGTVRQPRSRGKIERYFRTVKMQWMFAGINWEEFKSLQNLNQSFSSYMNEHYSNVVHSALGMSPKERFYKDSELLKFVPATELAICFMHTKECRVSNDALIRMDGKSYEVPQQYIRKRITVKFLPSDMSELFLFEDGELTHMVTPVKRIDNAKSKRNSTDFSQVI